MTAALLLLLAVAELDSPRASTTRIEEAYRSLYEPAGARGAARDLAAIITAEPALTAAYARYVEAAKRAGLIDEAAALFTTIHEPALAAIGDGLCRASSGDRRGAIERLLSALLTRPDLTAAVRPLYDAAQKEGLLDVTATRLAGLEETIAAGAAVRLARAEMIAASKPAEAIALVEGVLAALPGSLDALDSRARVLDRAGKGRESAAAWTDLLAAARAAGDRLLTARAMINLAIQRYYLREHPASRESAREAATLFEALGDRPNQIRALNNLATFLAFTDELEEATRLSGQALALARAIDDPHMLNLVLDTQSEIHSRRNLYADALRLREEALLQARRTGEPGPVAASLGNLGSTLLGMGRLEEARARFEEALPMLRASAQRRAEGRMLGNLGIVQGRLGDLDASLARFGDALEVSREIGDLTNEARLLNSIGSLHMSRRDLDLAIASLDLAREMAVKSGAKELESVSLLDLGNAYAEMGDPDRAIGYMKRGLEAAAARKDLRRQISAMVSLAQVEDQAGRTAEAVEWLSRAWPLAESLADDDRRAMILLARAHTHAARGDPAAARADAAAALDYQAKTGATDREAPALLLLARLEMESGSLAEAERLFARARDSATEREDELLRAGALTGLARVHRRRGETTAARSLLEQAIALVEGVRLSLPLPEHRATFLATSLRPYIEVVDLLAASHPAEAFEVMERARARSLLDQMARSRLESLKGISEADARRLRAAMQRLVGAETAHREARGREAARKAAAEAQDAERAYETALAASSLDGRPREPVPGPVLSRLQNRLGPKSALIEYQIGEESVFAAVVTEKSIVLIPLGSPAEIARLATGAIETLAMGPASPETAWREAAALLHARLIAPAIEMLPARISRLIFVPDGPLWLLPFEALAEPGADRPFLIERFEVLYAPSGTLIASASGPEKSAIPPGALFGVADPSPVPGYPPLPYSRKEIEEAARWFGPTHSRVLTGAEATAAALLREPLADFGVLHLATHAIADQTAPARSRLILAAAQGDSAPSSLSVREIINLDLRGPLVVLSSCNSARGRVLAGEGIEGLVRGFLSAGASSVVASLWSINDRPAAILMREFYRALKGAGLREPAALRQAKLSLIRGDGEAGSNRHTEGRPFRHPWYWAPYVLHTGGPL